MKPHPSSTRRLTLHQTITVEVPAPHTNPPAALLLTDGSVEAVLPALKEFRKRTCKPDTDLEMLFVHLATFAAANLPKLLPLLEADIARAFDEGYNVFAGWQAQAKTVKLPDADEEERESGEEWKQPPA